MATDPSTHERIIACAVGQQATVDASDSGVSADKMYGNQVDSAVATHARVLCNSHAINIGGEGRQDMILQAYLRQDHVRPKLFMLVLDPIPGGPRTRQKDSFQA